MMTYDVYDGAAFLIAYSSSHTRNDLDESQKHRENR
jgi:hypothetical protein